MRILSEAEGLCRIYLLPLLNKYYICFLCQQKTNRYCCICMPSLIGLSSLLVFHQDLQLALLSLGVSGWSLNPWNIWFGLSKTTGFRQLSLLITLVTCLRVDFWRSAVADAEAALWDQWLFRKADNNKTVSLILCAIITIVSVSDSSILLLSQKRTVGEGL